LIVRAQCSAWVLPGCRLGQEVYRGRGFRVPEAWSQQWRCLRCFVVACDEEAGGLVLVWAGPCNGTIRESGVDPSGRTSARPPSPTYMPASSAHIFPKSDLLHVEASQRFFHSLIQAHTARSRYNEAITVSHPSRPCHWPRRLEQKAISANSVDHGLASLVASDGKAGMFGMRLPIVPSSWTRGVISWLRCYDMYRGAGGLGGRVYKIEGDEPRICYAL
jgi:hypothetical protein